MSTTVIASRFGSALFIAPWLGSAIDTTQVRSILLEYGLELLPGALDGNEFIAAQGLSTAKSARLAEDLRGIGLTVRVVNKTALTQSARVGNAMVTALIGTLLTLPVGIFSLDELRGLLLIPGLYFLFNLLTIARRGGAGLPLAGCEPEHPVAEPWAVQESIASMKGSLPDHQLEPLLQRARDLEAMAEKDPHGLAAAELAAIREEQSAVEAKHAEVEAKALRAELARARSAITEAGRG